VALVDLNPDWARETKRMIDEEGGISETIQADVTDEESCRAAVARTVELFGAVHILVNIGGWACSFSLHPPSSLVCAYVREMRRWLAGC
jgi:NAD(P)-dependent dehydrogenase (short-subunit alcohol dehydrogenase family)